MEIKYTLNNVDHVAKQLVESVKSKTILIYGDMGAGKTTLIKAIVKALGSDDGVSSPTFSIVNEYEINKGMVYHFDLYRIPLLEDAYNFGIEDYIYSKEWCIIEWPQVIESILPEPFDRIDLEINPDNSRTLKLNLKTNLTKKKIEL
ncbi:tRNA (adenosine(37)-N6)-threonylcarbamoyltransferase complex ATPase subunit type 1 TsaE [Mariniflexile ostreae]|uniref:tRNA threonylcarbamoyladenosine biosynthesis protein TsaE n=1 Tax=Mariniflexile ostreae TaxID=1520892 RepID=A0ABV5FDZ7_9FLAO